MNEKIIELLCELVQEYTHPLSDIPPRDHSYEIGGKYLIRTVTMMYTGEVMSITANDLVLKDAAWIADSGRYSDALNKGALNEVEPYPHMVIITRQSIVDAAPWNHALPREQM